VVHLAIHSYGKLQDILVKANKKATKVMFSFQKKSLSWLMAGFNYLT
jgi:hypothetical protein